MIFELQERLRRTPRRRRSVRRSGVTASVVSILVAAAIQFRIAQGVSLGGDAASASAAAAFAIATVVALRFISVDDSAREACPCQVEELYDWAAVFRVRSGMIGVCETEDGRGLGAFAAGRIPRGTCLGDYEGELLDQRQYWDRYRDGFGAYAIIIDEDWAIDGAAEATAARGQFRNSHINHSSKRSNVVRRILPDQRRVVFYTSADIDAGQELLLDYGMNYWRGREHLIVE